MKTYYRGKKKTGCYRLTKVDCESGQEQNVNLAPVTKMELMFNGVLYDSDTDPAAFDWSIDPSNGRLNLDLGLLANVPLGRDTASELILYDPSNAEGYVWGTIAVNIIDVV